MSTTGHRVERLVAHLRRNPNDTPAQAARDLLTAVPTKRDCERERPLTEKRVQQMRKEGM